MSSGKFVLKVGLNEFTSLSVSLSPSDCRRLRDELDEFLDDDEEEKQ